MMIQRTKNACYSILAALAAVLLLIAAPVPAGAVEATTDGAEFTISAQGASDLPPNVQAEIAELNTHLGAIQAATSDGGFDFRRAVELGVPETVASDWAVGALIAGVPVVNAPAELDASTSEIAARAACRGENRVWVDAIGIHFRLSSCAVQQVIGAINSGVGATTVASIIAGYIGGPTAALSALVPAIMAWSAGSLSACAANGTGVEGLAAGLICWAQ